MSRSASPPLVVITGAGGTIGSVLRDSLDDSLFTLRLVDRRTLQPRSAKEDIRELDLRDLHATQDALAHADAVVHLAARPDEASFDEILQDNVVPTFNVYEASRRSGVRRIVFASSVHVSGYRPWGQRTTPSDPLRPDTFYALSKVYGEHLGQMYADRYGMEVVNLRVVGFATEPDDPAFLWGWLSPGDTVRLFTAALTAPLHAPVTCYGISRNQRRFYSEDGWRELGYEPRDDAELFASRWPDAVPPRLQGMEFADPGYTGK